jgi:hypothetical protein
MQIWASLYNWCVEVWWHWPGGEALLQVCWSWPRFYGMVIGNLFDFDGTDRAGRVTTLGWCLIEWAWHMLSMSFSLLYVCKIPLYLVRIGVSLMLVCHLCWCDMCWTIYVVLLVKTYVFLCFILCYMLFLLFFYLCFKFLLYKVFKMCTTHWITHVWFVFEFSSIFIALETQKPTVSIFGKTAPVYQQNRLVNQKFSQFIITNQKICPFKICTCFQPILSVFAIFTEPV